MTQLTLTDACTADALKREGRDAIEQTDRAFIVTMRGIAKGISQESGFVSIDNLRVHADRMGWQPKHPNSWGSVMKGKGWTIIRYQKSALPRNHARLIALWKWEP